MSTAIVTIDATGKPASACLCYLHGVCTLALAGHCRSRDKRDPKRCHSGGKATWCGVALRRRA